MFDIWDVHGRAVPYTLRPRPPSPSGVPEAHQVAPVRPYVAGEGGSRRGASQRAAAAYAEQRAQAPMQRAPVVEDWMTRPVITLPTDTTLVDAWTLFRARQFRHVPIVDADDRAGLRAPVGMLSDRDLLQFFADHQGTERDELPPTCVQEVMTRQVLTARPGTSIRHISHVMVNEGLSAVPVVSPEEGLIGILTRSDILRLTVELTSAALPAL